jgi:hypothetical protein
MEATLERVYKLRPRSAAHYPKPHLSHNSSLLIMSLFRQPLLLLALASTLVTAWPNQHYKTANFTPPVFNVTKSGGPLADGLLFIVGTHILETCLTNTLT